MRVEDRGIGFCEIANIRLRKYGRLSEGFFTDGKKISEHRRAFPISGDEKVESLFEGGAKGDPLLQVGASRHV